MGLLSRAKGGIHYSKLTKKQIKAVSDFYGRKMVEAESKYHYFFNDNGECESAS